MKRRDSIEASRFDRAVSHAFQDSPDGGAFGALDDLKRRRMINEALARADASQGMEPAVDDEPKRRPVTLLRVSAAAAAVLCLFGAGLLLLHSRSPETVDSTQPTYFGEVRVLGGALFFGETPVAINAPVPANTSIRTESGTAQLRLPTGITWQLGDRTRGEIRPLSTEKLQVAVLSGESWFRVDPNRKGPSFSVQTPMGRIDVTGTIFIVNAAPSDVTVTLLKGSVWVTLPSGGRELVETGKVLHLGEMRRAALSEETHRRLLERIASLHWDDGVVEPAPPQPASAESESETEPPPEIDATVRKKHPRASTPKQLLEEIQTQRKMRNWGRAAELYEKLIKAAPNSETATVARVSLGDIYLTKLQRSNAALAQFDTYLRSGHTTLRPEAVYGRCNALRALGRKAEEIRCLETFLRRNAHAFQAPEARARLKALEGRSSAAHSDKTDI